MKPKLIRHFWDSFSQHYPRLAYDLNYLRRYQRWEPDLWLIPHFCNKNSNSIDIGANIGIFSRWMAKHSKHVESFECNPALFPVLKEILPNNVILNCYALSSSHGTTQLRFDPTNTGIGTIEQANKLNNNAGIKSVETIDVEVRRLDEFVFNHYVSFIKIDVEGHELEVLKGATSLLERDHPTLLVEIEERHCPGNLKAVPEWLGKLGYEAMVLGKENKLIPMSGVSKEFLQRINNFWFCYNEGV